MPITTLFYDCKDDFFYTIRLWIIQLPSRWCFSALVNSFFLSFSLSCLLFVFSLPVFCCCYRVFLCIFLPCDYLPPQMIVFCSHSICRNSKSIALQSSVWVLIPDIKTIPLGVRGEVRVEDAPGLGSVWVVLVC